MWVADMDFPAADCIRDALRAEIDNGFLGYFGDPGPGRASRLRLDRKTSRLDAPTRLDLTIATASLPDSPPCSKRSPIRAIMSILFSPVYHSFFGKTRAKGREILQSPLVERDGRYEMDLDALAASLTGREKILVFCSPHNPGGRLWSTAEIRAVAAFCEDPRPDPDLR